MRALSMFSTLVALASSTSMGALADEPPRLVPGQWVAYVAPTGARSITRAVFVPERKPEGGERVPPVPRSGPTVTWRCLGEWQLRGLPSPSKSRPLGVWAPSPSGDDRWVWVPGKSASVATEPAPMPETAPDYGDEFVFCARAAGETVSVRAAPGKRVPGSWVTLVDGKRTTTLFVANTAAAVGDVLPDAPAQERRIRCPLKSHPIGAAAGAGAGARSKPGTRPKAPYGQWVPDPFGSQRWAWVPSAPGAFALRPSASPTDSPARSARRPCSWFDGAE